MRSLITCLFSVLSDVLDFIIFQGFLVCVHYMLEAVRLPFPVKESVLVLRGDFWMVVVACSPNAGSTNYAINLKYNSALHKKRRSMSVKRRTQNAA